MPKLPEKIEDWTEAPWEKEGAGEFDPARAKELVFNISKNLEREQEAHSATKETVGTLTTEKDALIVRVETLEADTSADELKTENARLKQEAETARQQGRKAMLDAVGAEFGLTDKQKAKLDGDDIEALRLDAKETFGDPKPSTPGEGEQGQSEEAQGTGMSGQPRTDLRNGGTLPTGSPNTGPSRDEVLASIPD